ncbi:MAG: alpha/beta fold hydrolase [Pseudonocardiaceae bacterium]|nr:alpha/beta fold hydrolase [Pseudonocardiaceae bacterium]
MTDQPIPFRIDVEQDDLDDLVERLRRTRWPERETVDSWSQGIPQAYVRELCGYWARDYDWRATERRLNAIPQYRIGIDGLGIHFLHARSPHPDALPLLLTHGWPGSIVEFLDVLAPLTDPPDPADAFHVVCPSLPGFGFSDKPTSPGWGVETIAVAWAELMARLGYDRYAAQGGDWGSMITATLGSTDPDHLAGIHLTMPLAPKPGDAAELTEREQAALADRNEFLRTGTGYSRQQSTRPQTLGYGLVDSPSAQAAWIVEKFWAWTDCDGHPENVISRDTLLDNVMLYWLPATGASSARLYWESYRDRPLHPVHVPTGCSIFPKEINRVPRDWLERRFTDLRYFNELDSGGHFASLERPDTFVDELRTFFRDLRRS